VEIDFSGTALRGVQSADVVTGDEPDAKNTYENPDRVTAQPLQGVEVRGGKAYVTLPPLSVAAITFTLG
jgi:alpha-L-arabinofuranosidase